MPELNQFELFILAIGSLLAGIVMLFKGGNWTIDSAVFVAKRFNISSMVIGFTIVAFGTSLPELIVSVVANLTDSPGIAIGNVVGSNIANILLVLGATAIFSTMVVIPRAIMRDLIMMLVATSIATALILDDQITRFAAFAMIVLLLGYVLWQYSLTRKGKSAAEPDVEIIQFPNMKAAIFFLLLGLASIALGAEFLVRGAKVCAEIIGVPDAVIGLSVIAIGTSLPELSTCIIAALRRHTDLIIGNILGSNVFNVLMILGVTAAIKPIVRGELTPQVAQIDIWVMLGVSVVFGAILMTYKKIDRTVGLLFTLTYFLYIAAIYALYLKDVTLL